MRHRTWFASTAAICTSLAIVLAGSITTSMAASSQPSKPSPKAPFAAPPATQSLPLVPGGQAPPARPQRPVEVLPSQKSTQTAPSTLQTTRPQIAGYPGLSTGDGSWTWENSTPQGNDVYAVACVDASPGHCTAVVPNGSFGGVLKTADFGATWTYQSISRFNDISCVSVTTCLAIGDAFGKTTTANTTQSWTALPTMSGGSLACLSANTCYVTQYCYIVNTADGGMTWTYAYVGCYNYHDIACVSTNCWAVGDSGRIIHTTDGVSWAAEASGTTNVLARVACPVVNSCWIAGWNGTILHTSDGLTWSAQTSGTTTNFNGVTCPGTTTCYAIGDAAVDKTTDGSTWSLIATGTVLWRASCPNTSTCMFVGPGGAVATTTNGGTTITANYSRSGAGYGLQSIACDASTDCYAVGYNTILHTTDGVTWAAQTTANPGQTNYGVACPALHNCFIVGSTGSIQHTSDGTTWSAQTSGTTNWLYHIACPTTSICYVQSSNGPVYKTINGGSTWTQEVTGSNWGISLACPTSLICYLASGSPTAGVMKTVDGGVTWKLTAFGDDIYQIVCPAVNNCYGNGFYLDHTTDGGATWFTANTNQVPYWNGSLACMNVSTCMFSENYYQPYMYSTTDSGAHMAVQSDLGNQSTLRSIAFFDPGHIFAVGDSGEILYSTNAFGAVPCKTAWMGINQPVPQPYGAAAVTFYANTWGCPTQPLYKFYVLPQGSTSWITVRDWSTDSTWTWDSSTAASFSQLGTLGSYIVLAWIRTSATSASGYDTWAASSVSWTACDWTTTTPNPVQLTAGPAQNFNIAASGPGCLNPTYRVFMYNVGTGWVTLSNWTPGSGTDGSLTYGVATGSLANGNYSLDVHANQGNVTIDPNNPETWGLSTMIIGPAPCNYMPSVTVAEGNPADDGSVLHFTASVGGSPCNTPSYDWWVYGPQHQWIELTPGYVSSNTFTLDTSSFNWGGGTGLQPGTYSIDVHIKQPSTPATSYDTYALLSLTLRGCVAGYGWVSQNPVPVTKTIGVYAGASCDAPQFRYSVMTPGSGTWTLLADYSANSVYYYDTTGKANGNYLFKVEIKETGSTQAYDTFMYAQSTVVSG